MESLPTDVLFEILARLPAKLVSQLRCMNKSMLLASSCPKFSSYQSQFTSSAHSGVFLQWDDDRYDYSVELLCLDTVSSGIPNESSQKLKLSAEVLGSGHGLVIIKKWVQEEDKEVMYVFNPVLPQNIPMLRLPSLPARKIWGYETRGYGSWSDGKKGLWISLATDHYTIICLTKVVYVEILDVGCNSVYLVELMVYDSRVKRWTSHEPRRILTGTRNVDIENLVIANGMIHIVSCCQPWVKMSDIYYSPYILAFQIDRPYMEVEEPEYCPVPGEMLVGAEHGIEIAPWGHDSLCLIRCKAMSTFMVWVTTDVRKVSSWVKTHQVYLEEIDGAPRMTRMGRFTLFHKSLLVFVVSEQVYAINLKDGELLKLGQHPHGWYALHGYTNTFLHP